MIKQLRMTHVVGLEVPNSNVKWVTKHSQNSYLNTLTKVERNELNETLNFTQEDIRVFNGEEYLVGLPNAQGSGGISSARYTSKQFKTEVAFALAEIVRTPNEIMKVVTGVPAIEIDNEEMIKGMKENILGKYEVGMGNFTRTFEVTDVTVIPQPIGTLLSHFFTKDLKQRIDDEAIGEDWLVLDVGWGTTDICIANASSGVSKIDTLYEGMSNVFSELSANINKTYPKSNIKRIIPSAYNLSKKLEKDNYLKLGANYYDITSLKEKAFTNFADKIYHHLINNSYDLETAKILLTGGGGLLLDRYIRTTFIDCDITLVNDPIMANAIGFYILGEQRYD